MTLRKDPKITLTTATNTMSKNSKRRRFDHNSIHDGNRYRKAKTPPIQTRPWHEYSRYTSDWW